MAKRTSKQGKNANKNTENKTVDAVTKVPVADAKAPKKVEKPVKDKRSTKEQPKTSKTAKAVPKKDGIVKKAITYIKNVRLEVKRTTWPSRPEVLRMSLIVVGALIFFGVFIFIMDWVMTHLLELYAGFIPDPSAVDPSAVDPSAASDASAGAEDPSGEQAGE